MTRQTRKWIEITLAGISAVLTVVSAIWPTWIELLLHESPDGGDGSLERLLALMWLAATVVFALLARRSHRLIADQPAA